MIDGDGAEHGTVLVSVAVNRVICHSGIVPGGCCIVFSLIRKNL